MPTLARQDLLHHRGEHGVGTVKGFSHLGEDLYVPRAMWTETLGSPLKQRGPEFDAEGFCAEARQNDQQRATMRQYLSKDLARQVEGRKSLKVSAGEETAELLTATTADLARKLREDNLDREEKEKIKKVFKEGLDEQTAHHAMKLQEHRLREAHEAAEIKLRTTQQLCQELAEASRRKEAQRRELSEGARAAESSRQQQRAEKQRENSELRRNMREQLSQEDNRQQAQQERVRAAMAEQEANYRQFSDTAARDAGEKLAREERRQDRDEKHTLLRSDMHYAQREMARERQRQRMVQALDLQLSSKTKKQQKTLVQQDFDRDAVNESTRLNMEAEASRLRSKRAEELEHQAALVAQMHERQQRERHEAGPHHRVAPALKTMTVTPGLLAAAETWRAGNSANHWKQPASADGADLPHQLDAARHLCKPMGQAEVKPWVDIAKSYGPGGLVGVFGGEGARRSTLMSTGGAGRLMAKTADLVARDRQLGASWHGGLSPAELRSGRQAAAKRHEVAAADKALA